MRAIPVALHLEAVPAAVVAPEALQAAILVALAAPRSIVVPAEPEEIPALTSAALALMVPAVVVAREITLLALVDQEALAVQALNLQPQQEATPVLVEVVAAAGGRPAVGMPAATR